MVFPCDQQKSHLHHPGAKRETFVLGGLIHEFETKKVNKLPLLGDLPFVGRLLL